MNSKERAIEHASKAYRELCDAGISEEFPSMLMLIAQANRGTFFGSFGSDAGCFIEFNETMNEFAPVKLSFGLRRFRQSFFSRVWQAIKESKAILLGHDTEHEIELGPDDIRKFKDLLRVLK